MKTVRKIFKSGTLTLLCSAGLFSGVLPFLRRIKNQRRQVNIPLPLMSGRPAMTKSGAVKPSGVQEPENGKL